MAFLGLFLAYVIIILLIIEFLKLISNRKCCVKVFLEEKRSLKHKLDKQGEYQILPQPPGPFPWPILGNLVLLGKYAVPFEGFSALAKVYGNLYSLTLGSTRCIIVNNLDLIKEVLNHNGKFFGGRPNFLRYHKIFGGNRNNCKYSAALHTRVSKFTSQISLSLSHIGFSSKNKFILSFLLKTKSTSREKECR